MTESYDYRIQDGGEAPDLLRAEMLKLFNGHYGRWGDAASPDRRGKRIGFGDHQLKSLLGDGSFILLARSGEELIGYAIGVRRDGGCGPVCWVTQLVVHADHQNRKVSSNLLGSAWSFSTDFAWGLASANPRAVRALERATRRRCDPVEIAPNLPMLRSILPGVAGYLAGAITVDEATARIDTDFPVSRAGMPEMIASVSSSERPWLLGDLSPTEEWLAVTFREQHPRPLTAEDIERLSDAGGSVVADAYDRMAAGAASDPHPWMRHTANEVDVILEHLALHPGARILDVGCGNGRHAVELALRGFDVTAVDRSDVWLEQAQAAAREAGVEIAFRQADARDLDLGGTFDAVICLYDVVGSFARDEDNLAILAGVRRHLAQGAPFAFSVMNRVVAERIAAINGDVRADPGLVDRVKASRTMQTTGNVWRPKHLIADPKTGLVFRREQFDATDQLPVELLVCDRRYRPDEIGPICRAAGLVASVVRPVSLGAWDRQLDPADDAAKEVLCLGYASD